MHDPGGNQFSEALAILNRYYREMATRLAEEVVENEAEFAPPFLGEAESLVEKYVAPLHNLGAAHEILRVVGEAIFREKAAQLGPEDYLCFGCRTVMRKDQNECPKCGWSWRKNS